MKSSTEASLPAQFTGKGCSKHHVGLRKECNRFVIQSHKYSGNKIWWRTQPDKHRIELLNRRCRQDESLQSLHSDIRRLAALAFPDVQPHMPEAITCDHFLGDPDFALKIHERHLADPDSALRITLQLEVWTTDTARFREAVKLERAEAKRVREITNKKSDPIDALQKEWEKKFAELENRIPKNLYNGGFLNHYRPTGSIRHTAPNSYSVAPSNASGFLLTLSSSGPNPANSGRPNSSDRPPGANGMNHNGNFNRPPNLNPGCYRC